MFYYIKGNLALKGENFAVIETGGVGYKIYTSSSSLEILGAIGTDTVMYTHLYVREDIMDIYGFSTQEELTMFLHLISVSGVGPKAALSILSVATPAKFAIAVITGDTKIITKAQGVGPKLAQRVILELKDKIKNEDAAGDLGGFDDAEYTDTLSEAVSALMVLGYAQNDAQRAAARLDASMPVEQLVKEALKQLMKQGI